MKKIKIRNSSKEYTVGKIVCVGRNFADHAKELGNEVEDKPVIFLKPPSAIIYSGGKIVHPDFSNMLHHEAELVLLIGKEIKNGSQPDSEDAVAGYGVGLDMTLRDLQNEFRKKGDPWTISKCFDTSAVLSDFILKKDYPLTLEEEIMLSVNGTVKQREKLNKMIYHPAALVRYISSLMTLEEGDLVFTGTPAGVGKVEKGDKLNASIGNILSLECVVA